MTERASSDATPAPHRAERSGHGDLAASLVLIFPLLLAYEVGVLFAGQRQRRRRRDPRALRLARQSRRATCCSHVAFAVGFLLWIRRGRRWATLSLDVAAPVILEAAIYALTLGAVGALIVEQAARARAHRRLAGRRALGAGVHEELVFRLGADGGLVALLARAGVDRRVVDRRRDRRCRACVFAAAHHLGAYGEPWTAHAFALPLRRGLRVRR